jgi:hypothetical protein
VALRNCSGKNANCFRVFRRESLYRHRGVVRSGPGGSHHQGRGPGAGRATLWCGWPMAPLRLLFGLLEASVKIGGSAFVLSNSENISCVTFLKHKNSRKQGTGTVASC